MIKGPILNRHKILNVYAPENSFKIQEAKTGLIESRERQINNPSQ